MRNGHFALHLRKLRLTAACDTHILDGFHQSVVHLTLRDGRQVVVEVVCVEIAVIFGTMFLGSDVLLVLPFFLENEYDLSLFVQKGLRITKNTLETTAPIRKRNRLFPEGDSKTRGDY